MACIDGAGRKPSRLWNANICVQSCCKISSFRSVHMTKGASVRRLAYIPFHLHPIMSIERNVEIHGRHLTS